MKTTHLGVNKLEEVSYDEARQWFWIRTCLWCLPSLILSIIITFAYTKGLIDYHYFEARFWTAFGMGILMISFAILASFISFQFYWMQGNWRWGFALNGPACAVISALAAFLVCGISLSFIQTDPFNLPSRDSMHAIYSLMMFGIGGAAFWGFIFGSWFAMRFDKYFIELY